MTKALAPVDAGSPTQLGGGLVIDRRHPFVVRVVLVCVAATHVLSGLKTPISAAIHGVDEPQYVFYTTTATLVVGIPAIALGAIGGGLAGLVLVLVALELAGVLVSEVAAYYAFDRFVLPETLHVQVGAGAVAGSIVWLASRTVDVSSARTLAVVLAAGASLHFAQFALASEQFREGSARTLQDLSGAIGDVRSV